MLGGDIAGFPNGRRVGDDVLDIVLQAAAGATPLTPAFNRSPNNTLGDGVNRNDVPYLPPFPYLGIPHAGKQIGCKGAAEVHEAACEVRLVHRTQVPSCIEER